VGNPIHGTGTVSFDGYGTTTVSGNSDYTGNTLINAGIVNLTSSTGLGSASTGTTVANGGQLSIPANVVLAEGLSLNGVGADGNGALRKSGAGITTINGPILLASDSTIGVDGGTLNLSNAVSGSAALTASGAGTLALNVGNTFSGGFNLNGPIVRVNDANALGTGPVTVVGNGRFIIGTGLTLTKAITANAAAPGVGQGLIMADDNTNGTVTTISGPLMLNVSATSGGHFVGPTSSGYLHVAGPVTNTVTGVVVARAGNVRFSGGGDYTVFTLAAGTTSLGANNGLSPSAVLTLGVSAAGTFDLNGFNQSLTGLAGDSANAKLVTNSGATLSTLTLNLAASNAYNGMVAGPLALVVNGSGSLFLSGNNAYTGNTIVNGGTLEIAQPTLAAGSTVSVANGAFLQLDFAGTNTVAGLVLGGMTQTNGVFNATTSAPFITGTGSLRVQTVNTTPTNLIPSRSGDTLTLGWPADHTGWRLQVQTNTLATGLGTNWVEVPDTATTNSYSTTLDGTNGAVFYRMVYP
jgi:autotransporter-associated beta strand protein